MSLLHLAPAGLAEALTEARRVTCAGGVGFVTVREGDGGRVEQVGDTEHRRYFCYWAVDDLDHVVERAGWHIIEGWVSGGPRDRRWITRVLGRRASGC